MAPSIQGRDLCPCVRADGATLLPRAGCELCQGTGGVGRDRPTKEEEKELWEGQWVASGPCHKVAGRWVADTATWSHPMYGVGRRRKVRRSQPRKAA